MRTDNFFLKKERKKERITMAFSLKQTLINQLVCKHRTVEKCLKCGFMINLKNRDIDKEKTPDSQENSV